MNSPYGAVVINSREEEEALRRYEQKRVDPHAGLEKFVLRSQKKSLCEFFLNKLRKYGRASSFKLLKAIVLGSM